jgi:preprotein translocase subunit YajC
MNSLFSYLLLGAPAGAEGGGGFGGGIMSFAPFILIIGVFYFLIIRPQNKKQKETQKMLAALKKGDKVVTAGGIHGVIQTVDQADVVLKIDEGVKVKFSRSAISTVVAQESVSVKEEKPKKAEKAQIEEAAPAEEAADEAEAESE